MAEQKRRNMTRQEYNKKFTNAEILKLAEKPGWMTFNIKGETSTKDMKDNGVRYIDIMVVSDGKEYPLIRETTPFKTRSWPRAGKIENGRPPSAVTYQTRILCMEENRLQDTIDKIVNEKYPNLSDEEFNKVCAQQDALIKIEYQQWCAERVIDTEFKRLLKDPKVLEILDWKPKKNQTVRGFIQYEREFKKEYGDDKKSGLRLTDDGNVILDEPIVYHRIKVDRKTGNLWSKIYDVTIKPKDSRRKIATYPDPEKGGNMEVLNHKTILEWLRPNSVCAGIERYQLCICKDGALLHNNTTELNARIAAKSEPKPQISKESLDSLFNYDGDYETEESAKQSSDSKLQSVDNQIDDLSDSYDV